MKLSARKHIWVIYQSGKMQAAHLNAPRKRFDWITFDTTNFERDKFRTALSYPIDNVDRVEKWSLVGRAYVLSKVCYERKKEKWPTTKKL